MRTVVLSMKDFVFADAVAQALQSDATSDIVVQKAIKPDEVEKYCSIVSPYLVIMEVTGHTPFLIEERLKIRNKIKEIRPECKVVLLVDEISEANLANKVREAKKNNQIDQFIYCSISAAYLVALMDAM